MSDTPTTPEEAGLRCWWSVEEEGFESYIEDDEDGIIPHLYVEPRDGLPPIITIWDEDGPPTDRTWAFFCDAIRELGADPADLLEEDSTIEDARRQLTLLYADALGATPTEENLAAVSDRQKDGDTDVVERS